MDVEFQQKVYPSIYTALVRAVDEWLLILMLLIDAAFSYLVTRFARYSQLQIPCLICSRIGIDHVLGHERLGFYWDDLICHNHKSNISSCHVHRTCESGWQAFDAINVQEFRLLTSKLDAPLINPSAPIRDEFKEITDAPSSNVKHDSLTHVVYSKIKVSESETRLSDEHLVAGNEPLVYAKVNVTSDGESDNPISDDESARKVESSDYVEPVSEKPIQQNYESKVADAKDRAEFEKEVPLEGEDTKVPPLHQMTTNPLNLTDVYKLAVDNKGRQLSGRLLEKQRSMKDSERASEDVKLLLSQISSRGIDVSSLHDMGPRVSANSDDLLLHRRISLERNGSNISLDGSNISEMEGETVVDRLTRQVEHDRKIIGALYKDLEEERNASAVAANQAMAMITRLQEEKAALYIEALQCLRITEEQAEYEGEALQKANKLLARKEEEIQNLQDQIELLKKKLYPEMADREDSAEEGSRVSGFKELDYRETSQEDGGM